jgi:hypothetical protein
MRRDTNGSEIFPKTPLLPNMPYMLLVFYEIKFPSYLLLRIPRSHHINTVQYIRIKVVNNTWKRVGR